MPINWAIWSGGNFRIGVAQTMALPMIIKSQAQVMWPNGSRRCNVTIPILPSSAGARSMKPGKFLTITYDSWTILRGRCFSPQRPWIRPGRFLTLRAILIAFWKLIFTTPMTMNKTRSNFSRTRRVWPRTNPSSIPIPRISGRSPYRGQPYFVSEFGGIWWNPEVKPERIPGVTASGLAPQRNSMSASSSSVRCSSITQKCLDTATLSSRMFFRSRMASISSIVRVNSI